MYHGTPQGGFTEFKDGTFFTDDKAYAALYKERSSGIYRRKAPENAKSQIYEVYLDIKRPFDTRNEDIRKIYEEDFLPEYVASQLQLE